MCGIFGFVNCGTEYQRKMVAVLNRTRGKEGVGLAYPVEKGWRMRKKGVDCHDWLIEAPNSDIWNKPTVLGHLRRSSPGLLTAGGQCDENTHPFRCNDTILAHNGYIRNWKTLVKSELTKSSGPYYVDSQGLCAVMSVIDGGYEAALKKVNGMASLWWCSYTDPSHFYLWCWKQDLAVYVDEEKKEYAFSSEAEPLIVAGFDKNKIHTVKPDGALFKCNLDGTLEELEAVPAADKFSDDTWRYYEVTDDFWLVDETGKRLRRHQGNGFPQSNIYMNTTFPEYERKRAIRLRAAAHMKDNKETWAGRNGTALKVHGNATRPIVTKIAYGEDENGRRIKTITEDGVTRIEFVNKPNVETPASTKYPCTDTGGIAPTTAKTPFVLAPWFAAYRLLKGYPLRVCTGCGAIVANGMCHVCSTTKFETKKIWELAVCPDCGMVTDFRFHPRLGCWACGNRTIKGPIAIAADPDINLEIDVNHRLNVASLFANWYEHEATETKLILANSLNQLEENKFEKFVADFKDLIGDGKNKQLRDELIRDLDGTTAPPGANKMLDAVKSSPKIKQGRTAN